MWRDQLGPKIWAGRRSSRYAAFCIDKPPTSDEAPFIAAYEASLEKEPSPPWADQYWFNIAYYELNQALGYISARDADAALAASNRAKSILDRLTAESPNPYLRQRAQQLRDTRVWTRERIARQIAIASGRLKEVRPYPLCVEQGANGEHTFWFAFENTAFEPTRIPIGPDNKITPPPFDRGQPTVFPASPVVLGFRIVTKEPAVTWHLQKFDVHASVAKTQPCPADLHERYTYTPPQRD